MAFSKARGTAYLIYIYIRKTKKKRKKKKKKRRRPSAFTLTELPRALLFLFYLGKGGSFSSSFDFSS